MGEFSFNECYPRFKSCMQEFGDFVFPSGKMIVIKEKQIIDNTTYTEEEQEINLKRCKRLAFYGKYTIFSRVDFLRLENMC